MASFQVYLDDEMVYEALGVPGGAAGFIDLEIGADDEYLTIVSLPGSENPSLYNFSILGDPQLIFSEGGGPSLDGDLNGDGFVGGDDLDIVRSFWGQNVDQGNLLQGDPSNDGFVGGDDLDIVRANWGQGTPPATTSVPEPSACVLLVGGLLAAFAPRRKWITPRRPMVQL